MSPLTPAFDDGNKVGSVANWVESSKTANTESNEALMVRSSSCTMGEIVNDQILTSGRIAKVIYQSKDAMTIKTFDAMDWLAQLVTHIPNKGESRRQAGLLWNLLN